eukprot:Rhum_TRINITY_DN25017_c0_g1::Rhum_TRINITY_DN25017_c0_g1_i1::g.180892::m.180892
MYTSFYFFVKKFQAASSFGYFGRVDTASTSSAEAESRHLCCCRPCADADPAIFSTPHFALRAAASRKYPCDWLGQWYALSPGHASGTPFRSCVRKCVTLFRVMTFACDISSGSLRAALTPPSTRTTRRDSNSVSSSTAGGPIRGRRPHGSESTSVRSAGGAIPNRLPRGAASSPLRARPSAADRRPPPPCRTSPAEPPLRIAAKVRRPKPPARLPTGAAAAPEPSLLLLPLSAVRLSLTASGRATAAASFARACSLQCGVLPAMAGRTAPQGSRAGFSAATTPAIFVAGGATCRRGGRWGQSEIIVEGREGGEANGIC